MKATEKQEGGDHYKDLPIQPYEYCHRNGLGPLESNVVKYVTRYKKKGGLEDLRKAIHSIEYLIELEYKEENEEFEKVKKAVEILSKPTYQDGKNYIVTRRELKSVCESDFKSILYKEIVTYREGNGFCVRDTHKKIKGDPIVEVTGVVP